MTISDKSDNIIAALSKSIHRNTSNNYLTLLNKMNNFMWLIDDAPDKTTLDALLNKWAEYVDCTLDLTLSYDDNGAPMLRKAYETHDHKARAGLLSMVELLYIADMRLNTFIKE